MSVTSGWGRLTWDQSQWGGSTIVNVGWGAQSWNGEGGWGDLSDQTITLDGQSLTTSLGSSSIRLSLLKLIEFNQSFNSNVGSPLQ